MKKGIALQTVVVLILAIISLAIGIFLIMKAGLLSNLQTIICTTLITWTSYVRGVIVNLLWVFFWAVIGVMALIMILFGTLCKAFPIGTAVCAALYAIFVAILMTSIMNIFGALPLMHCPNPAITIGNFTKSCGDSLTSKEVFMKEVAERSVDCWAMFGKGKFSPLTGKTPPNPRTCFIINFNLKESFTPEELLTYLYTNTYLTGLDKVAIMRTSDYVYYLDYWDGVKTDTYYNKELQKGRLFIKYYDDYFFKKVGDADCFTDWSIMHDRVMWCFDDDVTCEKTNSGCVLAADNNIGC